MMARNDLNIRKIKQMMKHMYRDWDVGLLGPISRKQAEICMALLRINLTRQFTRATLCSLSITKII